LYKQLQIIVNDGSQQKEMRSYYEA